jgi:hypothetical protein
LTFKNFLYKHTSLEAGPEYAVAAVEPMETNDVPIWV